MKLRLVLGAIAIVLGLYGLNLYLNRTPRYMESSPSTATPQGGEVREKFVVGFLPVT